MRIFVAALFFVVYCFCIVLYAVHLMAIAESFASCRLQQLNISAMPCMHCLYSGFCDMHRSRNDIPRARGCTTALYTAICMV